ncbi:FAD-binding oxidoreductase [Salinibacillus xinjiangensis]|uniref:FAD-binding protein n=1 Tax=Salinibacillus xinjiangensis TaxID=1229268 RepID=A0A6G1X5X5_9BACI|nr:FAD-binding oxidoreductase [Salinibacillus xinjiangensis]MRG86329.1 FAD-binding protein [Salinibacillus xinjiangensis]
MSRTLGERLGSKVVVPQDELYEEKRKVWNGAINRYPNAIVLCQSEADVVAAVQYANEQAMSIAIKGGGHHVAGTGVCDDGLMIDLSEMRKVKVDEKRKVAIVQGGATLGDVDKETQKYGLATPTGTVSETGIAGLALGGGLGYLRGKYGLTCDNLVGARVVTANGIVRHVSADEHADLFWAIRGGGGNFGVVTSFEFQLHEVGPEVLGIDVMYDYKDAKRIFTKAQQFLNDAPDEVSFNLTAMELPPAPFLPEFLHHKKVVAVSGMYAGDPKEGEEIVQPIREWAVPIVDQTGVMSYVELQSKLDVLVENNIPVYGTSLYFSELNEETVDVLMEKLDHAPVPTVLSQLWALHGQMNRVPESETPFSVRDASFVLLLDAMAMPGMDEDVIEQWIHSIYTDLLPYSHRNASYLNGIGTIESATKATYAANYDRLVGIKKKYDPKNLFRHNHNVNPND